MDEAQFDPFAALKYPPHLLEVPAEIRVRLYGYLFDVNVPIPITVNEDRSLELQDTVTIDRTKVRHLTLSTQLLRTCRQLYDEGTAYLYGANRFDILARDTPKFNFLDLNLGTRLCINKLRITVLLGQQPAYGVLSRQFPAVPVLEIATASPGPAFLLAAYDLSKVLVCSQLFPEEPVLELHARVPRSQTAIHQHNVQMKADSTFETYCDCEPTSAELRTVMESKDSTPFMLKQLWKCSKPLLGLGKELGEHNVLRIHGEIDPSYIKTIEKYECTFGDCSFEKRGELPINERGFTTLIYVWKKKGVEAAAIRGKDLNDTAAVLRDFVPKLSQKFLEAMQQAGLDTQILEQGQDHDNNNNNNNNEKATTHVTTASGNPVIITTTNPNRGDDSDDGGSGDEAEASAADTLVAEYNGASGSITTPSTTNTSTNVNQTSNFTFATARAFLESASR